MSIRYRWLKKTYKESPNEYDNRINLLPPFHAGYAYFGGNAYDEKHHKYGLYIIWSGEINRYLFEPLSEYGFAIKCSYEEALSFYKTGQAERIYIKIRSKNGKLYADSFTMPACGKEFVVSYIGMCVNKPDYICFSNMTDPDVPDYKSYTTGSYTPAVFGGSYTAGSFTPGSFNLSSFNIGSFNIGTYNVSSFNLSSFNLGSFNIGSFSTGSYSLTSFRGLFGLGSFSLGSFNIGSFNGFGHEFEFEFGYGSGFSGFGTYNISSFYLGSFSLGMFGFGSFTTGSFNIGSYNFSLAGGSFSIGSYNIGSFNIGSFMAGLFNSCSYNGGSFRMNFNNNDSGSEPVYYIDPEISDEDINDYIMHEVYGIGCLGYGLNLI